MRLERLLERPYGRWLALAVTNWAWLSIALTISVRTTLAWNAPTGCLLLFLWVACNQIYLARLTTGHDHQDFWQRYGAGVVLSLVLYVLSPGLGFCGTLLGSLYLYQRYKHVRPVRAIQEAGAATTTFAAAKTISKGQLKRGDPGILWGGMRVPTDYATMHFLAIGTTGSGKTVTLRLYMQSVLQGIGQPGCSKRAFIYDPKGELYSILLGMGFRDENIAVMLPYDLRCRPWWMAKDIRSATQAETLAIILVPEKTNSKDDDYWRSTAILIIKATVRAFNKFCPERWTFRDLLLALRDQRIVTRMIAEVPALHHYAQTFGSEKTAANIMSTVISKVERFEPIAALWHKAETEYHTEPLSLSEWVESSSILLLGTDAAAPVQIAEINRVLFTRVQQLLMRKPEIPQPETFVVLDELGDLGNMKPLLDLATKGRSKGVAIAAGFQAEPQIIDNFNEHVAATILAQFNHIAALRIRDVKSAQWISGLMGKARGIRYTHSVSRSWQSGTSVSTSETQFEHDLLPTGELTNIPIFKPQQGVGLTGFYMGASNYWHTYSPKIVNQLTPKADARLNKILMPEEFEELEPWNEADLARLNITHMFTQQLGVLEPLPPKAITQGADPQSAFQKALEAPFDPALIDDIEQELEDFDY